MRVIWQDIEGYEGKYQIGSNGLVKSLKRYRVPKDRIIKRYKCKDGYLAIDLGSGKDKVRFLVHRLVAIAFVPNPENKPEVNHLNGDRSDCSVGNVVWATYEENQFHKITVLNRKKRGVYKSKLRWNAQIRFKDELYDLGLYKDKEDAYMAYYNKFVEFYNVTPWDNQEIREVPKSNKTKKRGVTKNGKRWKAMIFYGVEKWEYLGTFDDKEKAYSVFHTRYTEIHGVEPWSLQ